ncbi:MAG TPA: ABC transporter substrate-binding protein [Burkholderiales bacterium]|nr:ABC transporter substrate-binding protein [Burkholderiales bacterium]
MACRANLPRLLALVALAASMAACGPGEPVRIGFLGGLTGSVSALGTPARDGALLAIEQRNAAGGIGGRQVQLLIRDDAAGPEAARNAVRELLAQGVAAIVGPQTSAIAVATVDLVNEARTLMISPTVTTTELAGKDDYFLRLNTSADVYARSTARYHYEEMGRRRIVAAYDTANRSYSESWLGAFKAEFERLGGRMLAQRPFRSGPDTDVAELARSMLQPGADAALVVAGAVDAAALCQQLRAQAPGLPIIVSEWAAANDDFIQLGGAAVDGVYLNRFLDPDERNPRYVAFAGAYRKRFNRDPGFASVAAYEATAIVLDGLARKAPGQSLKEFILAQPRHEGLLEPLVLDRYGDIVRASFVAQIRDGRYVTLNKR